MLHTILATLGLVNQTPGGSQPPKKTEPPKAQPKPAPAKIEDKARILLKPDEKIFIRYPFMKPLIGNISDMLVQFNMLEMGKAIKAVSNSTTAQFIAQMDMLTTYIQRSDVPEEKKEVARQLLIKMRLGLFKIMQEEAKTNAAIAAGDAQIPGVSAEERVENGTLKYFIPSHFRLLNRDKKLSELAKTDPALNTLLNDIKEATRKYYGDAKMKDGRSSADYAVSRIDNAWTAADLMKWADYTRSTKIVEWMPLLPRANQYISSQQEFVGSYAETLDEKGRKKMEFIWTNMFLGLKGSNMLPENISSKGFVAGSDLDAMFSAYGRMNRLQNPKLAEIQVVSLMHKLFSVDKKIDEGKRGILSDFISQTSSELTNKEVEVQAQQLFEKVNNAINNPNAPGSKEIIAWWEMVSGSQELVKVVNDSAREHVLLKFLEADAQSADPAVKDAANRILQLRIEKVSAEARIKLLEDSKAAIVKEGKDASFLDPMMAEQTTLRDQKKKELASLEEAFIKSKGGPLDSELKKYKIFYLYRFSEIYQKHLKMQETGDFDRSILDMARVYGRAVTSIDEEISLANDLTSPSNKLDADNLYGRMLAFSSLEEGRPLESISEKDIVPVT
jgi:hypothetical protein